MPKNGKRKSKGRSGKPLTRRKEVQESNRKMIDFFSSQVRELRDSIVDLEKRVAESHSHLWENQKKQNEGLGLAEEHVVLLRRVLNDALGGITRVTRIERRKEGTEEAEEVQVIDWAWYGEQLHFSDDPKTFVNGVVLTEEEVEQRQEVEMDERRRQIVMYMVQKAAEKDEDELRRVYDEGDLEEHLQQFLPPTVVWGDEMADLVPDIVELELRRREALQKKAAEMEAAKEKQVEEMEAARDRLLEETKQFGEEASHVIELIQTGREDEARVAMAELEKRVEEKEREAAISGAPELPEGAAVFGG